MDKMKNVSFDALKWRKSTGRNDLYQTDNRAGMTEKRRGLLH